MNRFFNFLLAGLFLAVVVVFFITTSNHTTTKAVAKAEAAAPTMTATIQPSPTTVPVPVVLIPRTQKQQEATKPVVKLVTLPLVDKKQAIRQRATPKDTLRIDPLAKYNPPQLPAKHTGYAPTK